MSTATHRAVLAFALFTFAGSVTGHADSQNLQTTEFCLHGEFDLGVRYQGLRPGAGELTDTSWCVVTEGISGRVRFSADGNYNPDMAATQVVSYLPPDTVRIVRRDSPPDLEFRPVQIASEADRHRRLDPYRFIEQLQRNPGWFGPPGAEALPGEDWQSVRFPGESRPSFVLVRDGRLREVRSIIDMPLRGSVSVRWLWHWPAEGQPSVELIVDNATVFKARGERRILDPEGAAAVWPVSGNMPPQAIPGEVWPSEVAMRLEALGDDVYLVHGVRSGFSHLVIDTAAGLVVADAPAGWVELAQVPAADLVPGLGISGLSEQFVDFLAAELPGRPLRAVAVTHAHDDHAGGARAFAAAGARVYAPAGVSDFLSNALNSDAMPADRFSKRAKKLNVLPVEQDLLLPDTRQRVRLMSLGAGPHVDAAMGVYAVDAGVFFQSDLHVPGSDADAPSDARANTECWFAAWATEHLPPSTLVVNSHSTVKTPVTRLQKYLESSLCNR